jgi:hypothetical protein
MDRKESAQVIIDYFFKGSIRKTLTFLMALGAGQLGLSWIDVVMEMLGWLQSADEPAGIDGGIIIGVVMIAVGFGGHVYMHVSDAARKERRAATRLIGRLRVLVKGFSDPTIKRDPGYYNLEIMDIAKAAEKFVAHAPEKFASDQIIASIIKPKFDASKEKPYFDVEMEKLEKLIERLEEFYEAK